MIILHIETVVLLFELNFLASQCDFRIYQPQNLSPVELDEHGSLTLLFYHTQTTSEGVTIKVDVMGFADPSGWPYTKLSLTRESGLIRGSAEVSGLVPGAVKIRLRLLTPDGTDAIGDESLELFLGPQRCVRAESYSHPFPNFSSPPRLSSQHPRAPPARAGPRPAPRSERESAPFRAPRSKAPRFAL